jgi:hypothetical protein
VTRATCEREGMRYIYRENVCVRERERGEKEGERELPCEGKNVIWKIKVLKITRA